MAWASTDNFDSYSNGNLDTLNGGSGWGGAWTMTGTGAWQATVQDSVVLQGTKSISMTPSNIADRGAYRVLGSSITSGSVEFMVRRSSNSTGNFYVILQNGTTQGAYFAMRSSGQFAYFDGAFNDLGAYSANTTYTVQLEFDTSSDTFNIKVDGVTLATSADFFNVLASVDRIQFTSADANAGVVNYFDAIAPAALGPTTVKTFDGVTQSTGVKTYFDVPIASIKTLNGIS